MATTPPGKQGDESDSPDMVGLPMSPAGMLMPGVSGLFLGLRPFHLQPQLPLHIQQSQPSTSLLSNPIILKDTMDQFFTSLAQPSTSSTITLSGREGLIGHHQPLNPINQFNSLNTTPINPIKILDPDLPPTTTSVDSTQRKMTLPACAICGADSTGIHFGSEACAACSAFFRRTVVLNKQYLCSKSGKCIVYKDAPGAQKCRACRFTKCIKVGMDRGAVQQRRDAIGKYSAEAEVALNREGGGLKRDREPDEADDADVSSTHDSTPFGATASSPRSPKSPKIPPGGGTVLDEFVSQHEILNRNRKLFYTSRSLIDVFDENAELQPVELSDFAECMFQLWQIEPRLAAEFISANRYLSHLDPGEKAKLLKNFMLLLQAVEEPYLTWKFCGLGKDKWMMPNRTYIDFNNIDYYYTTDKCIKGLNLDKDTARSLFIPSFQHALDVVGSQMAAMDIGYTELVALASILLLDPCIAGLETSTRELCLRLRNQVMKDLFALYQNGMVTEEPEVRLGMLINIISGIKVHAIKSMENMLMLKTFDICPRDNLFDEIVGIHG